MASPLYPSKQPLPQPGQLHAVAMATVEVSTQAGNGYEPALPNVQVVRQKSGPAPLDHQVTHQGQYLLYGLTVLLCSESYCANSGVTIVWNRWTCCGSFMGKLHVVRKKLSVNIFENVGYCLQNSCGSAVEPKDTPQVILW